MTTGDLLLSISTLQSGNSAIAHMQAASKPETIYTGDTKVLYGMTAADGNTYTATTNVDMSVNNTSNVVTDIAVVELY